MAHAPQKNEDVEDGMEVFFLLTDLIKQDAEGIKQSAAQDQGKAPWGQALECLTDGGKDRPAHAHVADHAEQLIFMKVDGGESRCQCRQRPDHPEGDPTCHGIGSCHAANQNGCIGSRNQKIDGTVVYDLKDLFCHVWTESVVHAGHGIQRRHGGTEGDAAKDPRNAAPQGRQDHAKDQRGDSQGSSHDMGDHIKDLLPFGIGGKASFSEPNSFFRHIHSPLDKMVFNTTLQGYYSTLLALNQEVFEK